MCAAVITSDHVSRVVGERRKRMTLQTSSLRGQRCCISCISFFASLVGILMEDYPIDDLTACAVELASAGHRGSP